MTFSRNWRAGTSTTPLSPHGYGQPPYRAASAFPGAKSARPQSQIITAQAPVETGPPPVTTPAVFRAAIGGEFNSTSGTITLPSHLANDLLILCVARSANEAAPTVPGDWVKQNASDIFGSSLALNVYTKIAGSSEASFSISPVVSGRVVWTVASFSGADTTTPVDVALAGLGVPSASASAIHPTPSVTAATAGAVGFQIVVTKGAVIETEHVPPAGVTRRHQQFSASTSSPYMAIGTEDTAAPSAGATLGNDTWTATQSTQYITATLAIRPGVASTVTGSVDHLWPGGQTHTTAVVKSKVTGATSVRLAYSTDPAMASPAFVAAQVPDGSGRVTHTLTGLAPNTRYYLQLADTPSGGSEVLVGSIGQIKTLQTPGTPAASKKIIFGGCVRTGGTGQLALSDAVTWGADYGIFNGDFTYAGTESTAPADHAIKLDQQLAAVSALRDLVRVGGAARYGVSDHDCGVVDNGDSNNAWTAANIVAYKQVVPHGTLLDPSGTTKSRDQQWDDGRLSFFLMDNRSTDRSPGANADDSNKTLLGADQKARLLNWLSNTTQPFCVILGDTAWMGAADMVNKPDWWPAYTTERTQVINAINAAQARGIHVEMWHGDSHGIGYATAAKNTWGNFPVICAAPYDQDGGGRNTSTFTSYFNNLSAAAQQYARITFADNGTTITRTLSGWDAISGTEKLSDVQTVTPSAGVSTTLTPTDSTGSTDSYTLTSSINFTDNTGSTDSATLGITAEGIVNNSTGLTDTVSFTHTVVVTDSTGLTDTNAAALSRALAATDSTGLTDATAFAVVRTQNDSTGSTDTATVALTHVKAFTDNTDSIDTWVIEKSSAVAQTDSTGSTDTSSLELTVVGGINQTDSTGLVDNVNLVRAIVLNVTDSTGSADTSVQTAGLLRTDSTGSTDTFTLALNRTQSFTDSTGSTDAATSVSNSVRDFTDSTGSTDTYSIVDSNGLTVNESTGSTDSVSFAHTVIVSDSTGSVDTSQTAKSGGFSVTDSSGATDSVAFAHNVSITELNGLTDAATQLIMQTLVVTDNTGSTDTINRSHSLVINEASGLSDQVLAVLSATLTRTDSTGSTDTTLMGGPQVLDRTDSTGLTDTYSLAANETLFVGWGIPL